MVGALDIVVLDEGLGDLPSLLQGGRTIQGETLVLRGAMRAFHKGVLWWVLRITDVHLDAQTGTEAHQRRGKITAMWTPHPARIAIQGEQLRPAMGLERLGDGRSGGFGGEILAHLRLHQQGGAHIQHIECFDNVLLLAEGIGRHRAHVFEIQLPAA